MGENSDFVRVRMPAPWKADGAVTQAKLDLDRTVCSLAFVWFWTRFPQLGSASLGFQTFWETNPKVQGNPRVWEALRVACEALLAGDVELCNTILEVRGSFPSRPYMVAYFLDDSLLRLRDRLGTFESRTARWQCATMLAASCTKSRSTATAALPTF
jgi:hypothetical protein